MKYAMQLGLKGLRRHPRTMLLAIVTMALGLAATMTMLTLLAMLSIDPLPGLSQNLYLGWVDSRQAAKVGDTHYDGANGPPRLLKLTDVEALAAAGPRARQSALVATLMNVDSEDRSHQDSVRAVLATGPMPSMFGVPLQHGRYWTPQEEREHAPVAIIDRATSLKLLGTADGTGQRLHIGTSLFRVVGISGEWNPQPHFYALQEDEAAWGKNFAVRMFLPLQSALDAGVVPYSSQDCDRGDHGGFHFNELDLKGCRFLQLWAELPTPGAISDFQDMLDRYARQRHAEGVFARPAQASLYSVRQWLAANRTVPDSVHLNLWLAVGLLALCMVNVAGLLAARFLRRSGELGIRRVLGAPRRAIIVQCLTEASVAGLVGGLLALPLTLFGLWVIRLQDHGYTDQARLNPLLFLALLGLAVLVGLLVGLLPAWRATRIEPALQVKSL
ncbi:MAG: ABC transporter permease [Pseudomonas sp.]